MNTPGRYASGRDATDRALSTMQTGEGRYAAHFRVVKYTPDIVWIVDEAETTGCVSVTNAAERVCRVLYERFGNRRFLYQDTMQNWDELVHDHGKFVDFKPARGQEPGTWADD